jgi:hypothetical protein
MKKQKLRQVMLFGGVCHDDTDNYISYSTTEMGLKGSSEWKELQ